MIKNKETVSRDIRITANGLGKRDIISLDFL